MYFCDDKYDLAFIHITTYLQLFDNKVTPESVIGDDSMVTAGRDVFFLGYPVGLHGKGPNTPLVRGGIIAGEVEHTILLDGNVFGGSSGSPVFLTPDMDNNVKSGYLIGIICRTAMAPSKQNPSIPENIGIGVAIKISYILDTIRDWLSRQ